MKEAFSVEEEGEEDVAPDLSVIYIVFFSFDGVSCHFQQYFSYIVAVSFYWWRKQEDPENTTDLLQVTDFYHIILYNSSWLKFELITSVVIGTDCTGSCKSNYHTIMTRMASFKLIIDKFVDCHNIIVLFFESGIKYPLPQQYFIYCYANFK